MVERIEINNYKSIVDMSFKLGKVNIIIGPNGCGKSNILEAISMASAASRNKLDLEYLQNRDIRVTDAKLMVNAFDQEDDDMLQDETQFALPLTNNNETTKDIIRIGVNCTNRPFLCQLKYDDTEKEWINYTEIINNAVINTLVNKESSKNDSFPGDLADGLVEIFKAIELNQEYLIKYVNHLKNPALELGDFLIYRPTEHFLRKTFDTTIFPLGVHGEGLLKYLKECAEKGDDALFKKINRGLLLLDWFDGFSIPENLMTNEYRLNIGDRYLKESLHYFDQRSTNEGFLFLLFYLTLFNSKETPEFFAVDNIETALNPKLATMLMKYMVDSCFENDKQVIITTHSPFVLDGIDIENPDIKLYVCRRDIDGHTHLEQIPFRKDREMKLSQLWMSGLIGGLPDNF